MSETYEWQSPARQPGYDAVWKVFRDGIPGWDAHDYLVVWRAVEAFADAMELPR